MKRPRARRDLHVSCLHVSRLCSPRSLPPLAGDAAARYKSPMPRTKDQLLSALLSSGVVAVIRAPSRESLAPIADALLAGGVLGIEVTMSTPGAIAGIERLADSIGDRAIVG